MKTADKWLSLFIRLRDSKDGIIRCCSCGMVQMWRTSDCGHFINRGNLPLRFSEENCHAQCRSCNRFDEGNAAGYYRFMQTKYGEEAISKMMIAKHRTIKLGKFELKIIADTYKKKAQELAKQKGLKI